MSSYARNLLSRGEEVVFESRQHWFAVLAKTWLWVIGAIIAFALLLWVGTNEDIGGATVDGILTLVLLLVLILALARIGLVVWAWRNQEYLVTTRRIIKSEGIFNKQMGDSSLEKVNDAHLTQSWVGRIFDYGTLDILTAAEEGGGPIDDYPMLAEPVKFKIAMLNQKELLERPDLAPPPSQRSAASAPMQRAEPMPPRAGSDRVSEVRSEPAPATSSEPATPPPASSSDAPGTSGQLASTLESLAGLRDRGLITPEEYEAKKRELLERM